MKTLFFLGAVVVIILGSGIFALRSHGLSARSKPWAIEVWIARNVRSFATPIKVRDLKNPLSSDPVLLAEARDHFADHCAQCHANSGSGKTMFGEGMYPPPPDLRLKSTQELTDGELFNIVQNGIRFTGMPGFGGDDVVNWKLVLFLRHIPDLSEEEQELMSEVNKMSLEKGSQHENH